MILLIRLNRDNWCVGFELEGITERCNQDTAIAMLRSFGISFDDIQFAMQQIICNPKKPVAEFGFNRTFVCTRACESPVSLVS